MVYDGRRRRLYYIANREKELEYTKQYYKNHREHRIKTKIEWQRNNRERFNATQARYASKRHKIRFIGHGEIRLTWPIRKGECSKCHKKVGEGIKRTNMHHHLGYFIIFPWFGLEELCVACHNAARRL